MAKIPDTAAKTAAKTATLNLRIDPDLKAAVERAARADRRSVTAYMETLIEKDLRERELRRKQGKS